MKKSSKLLGVLLAVCLMITILPAYALAEQDTVVSFSDVSGHWAEKYINYWANTAAKDGSGAVITGYPDGTFAPNANITRGAAAAMLDRANGYEKNGKTAGFSDVEKDNVFYGNIIACADNGVIYGYPDGSFKPKNNITREAAVAMIARCMMKESDFSRFSNKNECYEILAVKFSDADTISSDYYSELCYMCMCKNLDGFTDGSVKPKQEITRAQFAKLLYSTINESTPVNPEPVQKETTYSIQISLTNGNQVFVDSIGGLKGENSFSGSIMKIIRSDRSEINSTLGLDTLRTDMNLLLAIYDTNSLFGWNNRTKDDWNNYVHQCFKDSYGDLEAIDAFASVDTVIKDVGNGTYVIITPNLTIALIISAE